MTIAIVGREEELASIERFLVEPRPGLSAFVLEGQAGVGKSTLWAASLERAKALGYLVLSARPAEAEQGLAHAGLADLFEGVLDEVLPHLSTTRRRALEIVLLVDDEPDGAVVDSRSIGTAVRGALEFLSTTQPLVVAIDDVQWLDASSTAALAFALHRLGAEELLDEAMRMREIADALGDKSMLKHVDALATRLLVTAGRLDDARAGYEAAIEHWRDGDEMFISMLLWSLALVEL